MMPLMLPHRPFYFVRHGQTDWNVEGRMQGKTDIPLNDTGVQQAHAAARLLQGVAFDMVISSDLTRALQTAEIIATAHGKPLLLDPLLQERSFGSYEGRLTAEVRAEHALPPEESISKILPPDAEQWPETKARSLRAVATQLEQHPDKTLLFVGHAAFFRALYETLGGPRTEAKNATPYLFKPEGEGWVLETLA